MSPILKFLGKQGILSKKKKIKRSKSEAKCPAIFPVSANWPPIFRDIKL